MIDNLESLILDIMRLAESLGVDFAFPTQTLHVTEGAFPPEAPERRQTESARTQGRAAATALLSKARLREALVERSSDRMKPPVDLATPEAGSTSSAAAEVALRTVAGKNWPKAGEQSESEDGDAGGEGEG